MPPLPPEEHNTFRKLSLYFVPYTSGTVKTVNSAFPTTASAMTFTFTLIEYP